MFFIVGHDAQEVASDGVLLDLKLRPVLVSLGLFSGFFLRRGFGFLEFYALKSSDSKREELVIVVIRESSVCRLTGCVGVIAETENVHNPLKYSLTTKSLPCLQGVQTGV